MKDFILELRRGLHLGIIFSFLFFVVISVGKAFESELNIDNNTGFIQSLFFTSDGEVESTQKVIFNGVNGDVSLSGALNITPGAIADKKLVASDFSNLSVLGNDIGSGQVVNSHFVTGTITSNKIIDDSIISGSVANGAINNIKIFNNTGFIFNKVFSNVHNYFIDPYGLSSFYTLSGVYLDINTMTNKELIIGDVSYTSGNKLFVKGDLIGKNICDDDFCVGSTPKKIGTISANKRCQYKGGKINCIESFGD